MKRYNSSGSNHDLRHQQSSDDENEYDGANAAEHHNLEESYENDVREKNACGAQNNCDMEDDDNESAKALVSTQMAQGFHHSFSFNSNPSTTSYNNTLTENYEGDEDVEELEIDDGSLSYSSSEETEEGFIDKIREKRQKIAQWERNTKEHMRQNFEQFSTKIQTQASVLHNKIQTAKQSVNNTNQHMRQMFQNIRLKQTEKVRKAVKDLETRFQNMPSTVQAIKRRSQSASDAMDCDEEDTAAEQQHTPQIFNPQMMFGTEQAAAQQHKRASPSTTPNKQRPFNFHWKPQFPFPKFWGESSSSEEHSVEEPSQQQAKQAQYEPSVEQQKSTDPKDPWLQTIKDQKWDFKIASPPPPPQVRQQPATTKSSDFQFPAPPPSMQPIDTSGKSLPKFSFFNNQIEFEFPPPPPPQQAGEKANRFIIAPPPSYQQCYPDGAPEIIKKEHPSSLQHQSSFSHQFVQHAKNFALKHPLPSVPSFQFAKHVNSNSIHRPVKYRKIYPSNQPTAARLSTSNAEIVSASSISSRPFGLRKKSKTRHSLSIKTGIWSKDEHAAFENAYNKFGKQWNKIATLVPSRNKRQIMSHAQKCLRKEEKRESKVISA